MEYNDTKNEEKEDWYEKSMENISGNAKSFFRG